MFSEIVTLNQIDNITKRIIPLINKGKHIITLSGDLGAGKTTFIKHLLKNFDINQDEITSPTFNLLNIYTNQTYQIWHYDLYRLNSAEEIFNLNFDEALAQKLVIIEWPEIIKQYLPSKHIAIKIEILNQDQRQYIIQILN